MIYMETGSNDPTWNLAFEEYCLTKLTGFPEIMLLWQNHHSVIIGRYQNAEAEVNAEAVRDLGVNVARRSTGGGAVYHDMGNLNYSFIFPATGEDMDIKKISRPMVEALQTLGIPAQVQGRNDLVIEGQKISGTAQRLEGGRMLHHGTLLFDSDLGMLQKVLRVDPGKYKSKGAQSVRSRVTNIRPYVHCDETLQDFWKSLLAVFRRDGLTDHRLTDSDLAQVRALQANKYRSWDWIYGSAPRYQYRNARRFPGGKIEVLFDVHHGCIESCRIQGDFLGLVGMEGLESVLRGVPFRRGDVHGQLEKVDLPLFIGKITADELLDCMFQGSVDAERIVV